MLITEGCDVCKFGRRVCSLGTGATVAPTISALGMLESATPSYKVLKGNNMEERDWICQHSTCNSCCVSQSPTMVARTEDSEGEDRKRDASAKMALTTRLLFADPIPRFAYNQGHR